MRHALLLLVIAALALPNALANPASETWTIAAGQTRTVSISLDLQAWEDTYALTFGGIPDLRILRVTTESGVDIELHEFRPTDATQLFHDNPLPGNSGVVTIVAKNLGTKTAHLHVTGH